MLTLFNVLTWAGRAALVGRLAGTGLEVTQKATGRGQFFFLPAFNYFRRAKYQIFRDFSFSMYIGRILPTVAGKKRPFLYFKVNF